MSSVFLIAALMTVALVAALTTTSTVTCEASAAPVPRRKNLKVHNR